DFVQLLQDPGQLCNEPLARCVGARGGAVTHGSVRNVREPRRDIAQSGEAEQAAPGDGEKRAAPERQDVTDSRTTLPPTAAAARRRGGWPYPPDLRPSG